MSSVKHVLDYDQQQNPSEGDLADAEMPRLQDQAQAQVVNQLKGGAFSLGVRVGTKPKGKPTSARSAPVPASGGDAAFYSLSDAVVDPGRSDEEQDRAALLLVVEDAYVHCMNLALGLYG